MARAMNICIMASKTWMTRLISILEMGMAMDTVMTRQQAMKHMVQASRKTGKITIFFISTSQNYCINCSERALKLPFRHTVKAFELRYIIMLET